MRMVENSGSNGLGRIFIAILSADIICWCRRAANGFGAA